VNGAERPAWAVSRYNQHTVITRGLRSFLDRDWAAVREAKDAYWAEVTRVRGPLEALRIADELRRQVRQLRPGWPTAGDRAADLEAHIRLSERMRRGDGPGCR
jgi:hypothetical protein